MLNWLHRSSVSPQHAGADLTHIKQWLTSRGIPSTDLAHQGLFSIRDQPYAVMGTQSIPKKTVKTILKIVDSMTKNLPCAPDRDTLQWLLEEVTMEDHPDICLMPGPACSAGSATMTLVALPHHNTPDQIAVEALII